MMKGEGDVVAGFMNKVQVAMTGVMSPDQVAEQGRKTNEPGSGKKSEEDMMSKSCKIDRISFHAPISIVWDDVK